MSIFSQDIDNTITRELVSENSPLIQNWLPYSNRMVIDKIEYPKIRYNGKIFKIFSNGSIVFSDIEYPKKYIPYDKFSFGGSVFCMDMEIVNPEKIGSHISCDYFKVFDADLVENLTIDGNKFELESVSCAKNLNLNVYYLDIVQNGNMNFENICVVSDIQSIRYEADTAQVSDIKIRNIVEEIGKKLLTTIEIERILNCFDIKFKNSPNRITLAFEDGYIVFYKTDEYTDKYRISY